MKVSYLNSLSTISRADTQIPLSSRTLVRNIYKKNFASLRQFLEISCYHLSFNIKAGKGQLTLKSKHEEEWLREEGLLPHTESPSFCPALSDLYLDTLDARRGCLSTWCTAAFLAL